MSMSKNTRETLFTLAYIVLGVAGALLAGWLAYRLGPFHKWRPMQSFLMPFWIVGVAGSLIYASVQMRGLGYALLILVLFYLAQLALLGSLRGGMLVPKMLRAAIFALPVGISLVVSAYVMKSVTRIRFGRLLVTAGIVALGYVVMFLCEMVRAHAPIFVVAVVIQATIGAALGAGLGLGCELVDLIGPRPRRDEVEPA